MLKKTSSDVCLRRVGRASARPTRTSRILMSSSGPSCGLGTHKHCTVCTSLTHEWPCTLHRSGRLLYPVCEPVGSASSFGLLASSARFAIALTGAKPSACLFRFGQEPLLLQDWTCGLDIPHARGPGPTTYPMRVSAWVDCPPGLLVMRERMGMIELTPITHSTKTITKL